MSQNEVTGCEIHETDEVRDEEAEEDDIEGDGREEEGEEGRDAVGLKSPIEVTAEEKRKP